MIEAQRAYEMNSKAIQTADEMMQFARKPCDASPERPR